MTIWTYITDRYVLERISNRTVFTKKPRKYQKAGVVLSTRWAFYPQGRRMGYATWEMPCDMMMTLMVTSWNGDNFRVIGLLVRGIYRLPSLLGLIVSKWLSTLWNGQLTWKKNSPVVGDLIHRGEMATTLLATFSNAFNANLRIHHNDVIMSAIASQITSLTIVYSTVYSDADQRKHQNSASLAFVWGIHRWPVNSPHKGPKTRKIFPFDDVIMFIDWLWYTALPFLFSGTLNAHVHYPILRIKIATHFFNINHSNNGGLSLDILHLGKQIWVKSVIKLINE